MGSMMFSTLNMFAPFWVQFVVIIVLCIGFGVYVAKEERKKRGGTRREGGGPKAAAKSSSNRPTPTALMRPSASRPDPGRPLPQQSGSVSYNSYAGDHWHITGLGLSVEKRLEQLEVMKEAGLIDRAEYLQKRKEILKDK